MEPEMNSENWAQPNENQYQPGTGPQPKSFFQQERLQKTWLNVKLATWLKCLIVIAVLSVAAAFIAPKFTTAQPQQQETFSEYEGGWYDECESEDGWFDESEEDWYDESEEDWYDESEEDWYDDSEEDWSDDDYYYED